MMDQRAWEFRRQCRALGLLLFLGRRWRYLQGLKLGLNRRDIGIDQVIEQTGLLRIHLLATLGKLQTLELRDFVGQFLDHRRSEEHTSELQSLMRISYAVFCLKKKKK